MRLVHDVFLFREEPLARLERVIVALTEASRFYGDGQEKACEALRIALAAECPSCQIHVTGDELLALARPPDAKGNSSRIKRLRVGCCANPDCDSPAYHLIFQTHPDLDWDKLFSQVQKLKEEEQARAAEAVEAAEANGASEVSEDTETDQPAVPPSRLQQTLLRIGLAVAMSLLLFLIYKWYFGGRIPLIREPERFRVDPVGHETVPR